MSVLKSDNHFAYDCRFSISRERSDCIKHIANVITSFRILFALVMVLVVPFSVGFWICYLCGGLTDLFDGFVARQLKQQSAAGAKLDSIADLVFTGAMFIVVIKHVCFPMWLLLPVAFIALLRLMSYGIGFCKYRTFASLHTYANKATGALLFAFPLLYFLWGTLITAIVVCLAALLSSLEELVITIRSKELNRDCKAIFIPWSTIFW